MEPLGSFALLPDSMRERLSALSIVSPTPVQEKVIPILLEGKSLLFQSETGTGKTFAYLLPLAHMVESDPGSAGESRPRILICAPTYELSSQIKDAARQVTGLKAALFLGGSSIKRQVESLKARPAIVIGNPARLLELFHLKKLKTGAVKAAVFDEVDRLASKETRDSVRALLAALPRQAQIVGCSATVTAGARNFFSGIETVEMPSENVIKERIEHWAIFSESRGKIDALKSLLAALGGGKTLVFASRSDQVENITAKLRYKNTACESLHAKEASQERKAAFDRFKSGKNSVLVTSDLASRGLDMPNVDRVVQMDLPDDDNFFIHRAGRTARAGESGVNIVIGDELEMRRYSLLEKRLGIVVHPKILYGGKVEDAAAQGSRGTD